MNENDPLTERLIRLSRNAPMSDVDPLDDIQRGRAALHRRRLRGVGGIATVAVVMVGLGAATVHIADQTGHKTAVPASTGQSDVRLVSNTPSVLCLEQLSELDREGHLDSSEAATGRSVSPAWQHPSVSTDLVNYRKAAAAILDPSGKHLDAAITNIQYECNPSNGRLVTLGTKLGWTDSDANGVLIIKVASPGYYKEPSAVLNGNRWSQVHSNLPQGVTFASASEQPGGRAAFVQRSDGLTVMVTTNSSWGADTRPGTAAVLDLPSVDKLIEFAASPVLTFPASGRS